MRYGIFSDIHANLEALQAVLLAMKNEHIDQYVCLGDIVGYGANPLECVYLIKNLSAICVAGNHDWAVAGIINTNCFNYCAACAVVWTQNEMPDKEKNFLKNLSLVYANSDFSCTHSSLFEAKAFPYMYDLKTSLKTFSKMHNSICFIGHTHIPQIFCLEEGEVWIKSDLNIKLSKNVKYICNIGSVGQPRDGNPQSAYCIYDTKKKLVEIKRISYNIPQAEYKIRKAELPVFFAKRLVQGR